MLFVVSQITTKDSVKLSKKTRPKNSMVLKRVKPKGKYNDLNNIHTI